jgi:two-component system sensor histidine kinase ChvG
MVVKPDHTPFGVEPVKAKAGRKPRSRVTAATVHPLRRVFGHYLFSSLTRRILFFNLVALAS